MPRFKLSSPGIDAAGIGRSTGRLMLTGVSLLIGREGSSTGSGRDGRAGRVGRAGRAGSSERSGKGRSGMDTGRSESRRSTPD